MKKVLTLPKKAAKKVKRLFVKEYVEVVPTGELEGFLEAPQLTENNASGTLLIAGWVISRSSPIKSLLLSVNKSTEESISYGSYRPDVAQVYADVPNSSASGFGWNISLDPKYSGYLDLRLSVLLENGEKVPCFSRRVRMNAAVSRRSNLNPYTFVSGAVSKGVIAYKQGRLPLSPIVLLRYLRSYYRQMQAYQETVAYSNIIHAWQLKDPYERWIETNRLTPKILTQMQTSAAQLAETGVKISVIVPIYNTDKQFLQEMIASVTTQIYPHWELCLADDASTKPHVKAILAEVQASDPRIKVVFRPENGHIVEATNSALDVATGEFIALLDHDDLLSPDALLLVAECIENYPEVDWIYTDEDKIDPSGYRFGAQMKGGWSPEMAITHNYTHHLAVFRRSLVEKVGRLRKGYQGAQDLDLFLRIAEATSDEKIKHIPHVCYHWRVHPESTASRGTQKQYVFDSAYRAIEDAIARRGLAAKPFLPAIAKQFDLCLHQLKWDNTYLSQHPVTIVIPTRDRVDLLTKCVNSLVNTVDERYVKLIIVDDGSVEAKTRDYLKKLEAEKVLSCRVIRPERTENKFNYARLMNIGTSAAETPYVLHLNNDIEATTPGWLEEMMGWMSIPGVGIVGSRLLYPDQTLQHAGVVVGSHNGLADHLFHKLAKEELGYIFLPIVSRNVTAVTGACLLTSTELYRHLGGFDQEKFSIEFNDVDYCLRVNQAGHRVVYTPQSTLIHLTSASRGDYYNPKEHLNILSKYRGFRDPYFNENLDLDSMTMKLDPLHFLHHNRVSSLKILLITHNLNLEGAPIMAYIFAQYFATQANCQVSVISLQDGALREEYEKLGIPVKVVDRDLSIIRETRAEYQNRLKAFGKSIDISEFDVVVSNTMIGFWGVELARLFNIPSVWHIHESSTIENSLNHFFGDSLRDEIREVLQDSFSNASRVVFVADATRKIFHEWDLKGRFRTLYGGMNLDKINEFRRTHPKSELRKKYGIGEDKTVISIIGTTCERKGQHIFLEAIKQLEKKYSGKAEDLCYLIVGARETIYLEFLRQKIKKLNLKNVQIIPETREVYDFFGLSDIFVCASFEESFPRVVLEAMAFELKIVSTSVFGIPEMIGDRQEAYLVPPGNAKAIAAALLECLEDDYSNRLPGNAYARVTRLFDNQVQLPKHLELLKEVALSDNPDYAILSD
ncbi:glycosyltransferase [Desertifilum sp. FACHB-1129]|uniref:Glycosyl transferase family 2 n=2 Tax=Desertifilum tharense IPPAS B-1220 TaxID=1781255 RepID=A0A1E5QMP3_9CYAN|nr:MULTISPECIES: glycosyltransferase [Desertifilum]MDA0211980.1 glycosyltransferase [Cyanobacteria bacterium FC1]MBD2313294.1 glycosyltransferase [Desertifilum sp. FACHB-1129]MBD2324245.1 glycosyltransferase [Desertifilum sp. FACHB-866]MBD2334259.1 glycosyltransferase [Desertifilum sp. FACHB-868]OEJ75603.1 hypothetical protein BH720_08815 [Desertifilum tharense IPPAS B-1220]